MAFVRPVARVGSILRSAAPKLTPGYVCFQQCRALGPFHPCPPFFAQAPGFVRPMSTEADISRVTLIPGDGIGPEISDAVVRDQSKPPGCRFFFPCSVPSCFFAPLLVQNTHIYCYACVRFVICASGTCLVNLLVVVCNKIGASAGREHWKLLPHSAR
jgi:hypothetical protein